MDKKTTKNDGSGGVITLEKPASPQQSPGGNEVPQPGKPVGRPKGSKEAAPKNFFAGLRQIATEDWGSRYYLYLYRLEPVIDRLRSGETKYVMRYSEPVDEQKIMLEHGSGRYRLNLISLKPAGGGDGTEIGRYDIDILNTAHPPKIPIGEWVDDPRNKKWQWAKQQIPEVKQQQQAEQQQAQGNLLIDAMRAAGEIRRDTREELLPLIQQEPKTNPMTDALAIAKELLTIRTENPMNEFFQKELDFRRAEMSKIQEELRRLQEPPKQQNGGLGSLRDILNTVKELKPELELLFPKAKEAVQAVTGRSPRGPSWWQQMIMESAPSLAESLKPLFGVLAMRIAQQPQPGNAGFVPQQLPNPAQIPGVPGQQGSNGQQQSPALHPALQLLQKIAEPMMSYFNDGESGESFGAWLMDGYGAQRPLQMARTVGVATLVQIIQRSPYAPEIAGKEQKFAAWLEDVLKYEPPAHKPPAQSDDDEDGDDEPVDLTGSSGGPFAS